MKKKEVQPQPIETERLTVLRENSFAAFFHQKALPFLLRLFLTWVYGAFLLRYCCETLHIRWEVGWWRLFFGSNAHGPFLIQFLRSPEQIANSFYHLENLVIARLSYAMDRELLPYITTLPMTETFPFLLGGSVLLCSLLFWIVYGKRVLSDIWVLLHIVLLSLPFLFREIPSFWNFFCLLILVLAMIASPAKTSFKQELAQKRIGRPEYRYAGAMLIFFVLLFLASVLLSKEQFHKTTGWLREQKSELTIWGEQILAGMDGENGRFPVWGKRYTNTDPVFALVVKWPEKEEDSKKNETMISRTNLYLKEYAAIHYGARGWEEYEPEEEARLAELAARYHWTPEEYLLGAEHVINTMEVYTVYTEKEAWNLSNSLAGSRILTTVEVEPLKNAKDRAFLLSGALDFGMEEDYVPTPVSDLYLTGTGKRILQRFTYPLLHYEQFRSWESQKYLDWLYWENSPKAEEYTTFVRDTCLELPEGLGDGFFSITAQVEEKAKELSKRYPNATMESLKIQALRLWFYENAVYDTEPGLTPEGWNMAEYFLTESRRGYCVHFASAAILLLRAMGIPARYAEGYLIKLPEFYERGGQRGLLYSTWEDGEAVRVLEGTVNGEAAHAWAEVWLAGLGFVPIEYTIGTEENGISQGRSDLEELLGLFASSGAGGGKAEEEDPSKEEPTEASEDLSEPDLPELLEQEPKPIASDTKDKTAGGTKGQSNEWLVKAGLLSFSFVLLLLCGTGGVRFWKKEHYRRMDNRKKVLYWYQRLDKLQLSDPPPKSSDRVASAKRIAQKARFSDLEVSWEEVRLVERCYLEQKAIKNVKKG